MSENKSTMRFVVKVIVVIGMLLSIFSMIVWAYGVMKYPDSPPVDISQQTQLILGMLALAIVGKGGQKIFETGGIRGKNIKMGYTDNNERIEGLGK